MNIKIKNLLFVFSFSIIGLLIAYEKAEAGLFDGWKYEEITSSGIVFSGSGRIKAVYASSATFLNVAAKTEPYFVIADTPGVTGVMPASLATRERSPWVVFPSTNSAANNIGIYQKVVDYGDEGVIITSAAYVFFGGGSASGQAQRVGLLYKQ